jgi:hypothetical protein
MGRIRTVKPEFFHHEQLSELPAETHLFAAGLLTYADDEGYFNANPGLVKAAVFPLRESSVSTHCMLTQLSNIGFLRFGIGPDGRRYGHVVEFSKHQRVNRPTTSRISNLDIAWEDSLNTHGGLSEDSPLEQGTGNREGNTTAVSRPRQEYPPEFESVWTAYPNRLGGNPKNRAFKAWNARRSEGHTPEEIAEGVERYARFCNATNKTGTELVKQAATFFGPDKGFLETWQTAPKVTRGFVG